MEWRNEINEWNVVGIEGKRGINGEGEEGGEKRSR